MSDTQLHIDVLMNEIKDKPESYKILFRGTIDLLIISAIADNHKLLSESLELANELKAHLAKSITVDNADLWNKVNKFIKQYSLHEN